MRHWLLVSLIGMIVFKTVTKTRNR